MALPRIDFGLSREERLPATLLIVFFIALCIVGGSSREDVLGQAVIRGLAVVVLLLQVVAGRMPDLRRYRACAMLLASMIAVAALQLVPLPPVIWTALPGRAIIAASPIEGGGWRPLNVVPDAGWNALFSLLVPTCVLVLISSVRFSTARRLQPLLVTACVFSAILALLQAAGNAPDNLFINGSTTEYGGVFANRNHQALFLAIGIAVAWFWGTRGGVGWRDRRLWLALCVIALLFVSILVTGSRSGALLGCIAVVASPLLALPMRGRNGSGKFRVVLWSVVPLAVVVAMISLSAYFGRASSLDRVTNLSFDNEFRLRSLPTVWAVAKTYFPFGAGLGTFDTVFRVAEPFSLLEPTYFNHAHNDLLESVIETGVFGLIILICAVAWIIRRVFLAVSQDREHARSAWLGAIILGLGFFASVSDYPARTPMIMACLTIAACWLTGPSQTRDTTVVPGALPTPINPL